jgi:hypothetical protein
VVNLKELTPVTETLNAKSNEVNQIIADLNAKLAKLNIGISATTGAIAFGNWNDALTLTGMDVVSRSRDLFALGYAKINEQWQLGIASYTETQAYENGVPQKDNDGDDETEIGGDLEWTPLLQATRSLRIAALSHVEQLITEIHRLAQSEIETINKARELTDNL